ncbi:Nuclear control of ATPase protein 2 [Exophiala xenobiotica]|uniref:Nuclear control of ATPase protein 2 n=1 Tax=Lithohypha guttulata TaxID=1690604 RepID=A0ABR0KGD1_9EURO|nr:Nuclear control of ATPase protein 2 [Lithohypha guttulata]KAK5323529.1 Nuclear control of ATPase protein 2 [Exophiala xenobiotica]
MSIVDDRVRRLDATLDRIQLQPPPAEETAEAEENVPTAASTSDSNHAAKLKSVIRSLSTTAGSRPLLSLKRLRTTIAQIKSNEATTQSGDEKDLEWLAVGKGTIQLYGTLLNTLLDQTIPLSESIWYWDDVLGSYAYTGLYTIQTSPFRFWHASKEIYADAKARYQANTGVRDAAQQSTQSLSQGWNEFYDLVQKSIDDRSLAHARTRILSPFALCRTEARRKQENIKKMREQSATAIGLLIEEGFPYHDDTADPVAAWRAAVAKSVTLLEAIMKHTQSVKPAWSMLEQEVFDLIDQHTVEESPSQIVEKLLHIIDVHLPDQERESQIMAKEYGKPSRWIRYWIPGLALFLSGSTLLRIFANRREEILTWIRELGTTTVDFWYNWVVDPVKRLIGTIRHDENSELAIMSKDSLKSDRDSLERMVVDFAVQHPGNDTAYTESQIATLRSKVREGDLSTVLKAYEKEMQSPVKNAIAGNLIRALLIQIQKTKVDVEVAMNGIDSILKSQELLFGMVGIAPGMVVSYLAFRWLSSSFGGRKSLRSAQEQGDTIRLLRNINRTLTNATLSPEGMLTYKDNGLLLCDIHVLRQTAARLLPGNVLRDFLEDINDLMNTSQGVDRQLKAVERLHWAYGKWLK